VNKNNRDLLPNEFESLEAVGEFWDTHSAADYWDEMEDVEIEIEPQRRRFPVLLKEGVYQRVAQAAAADHLSLDEFVNRLIVKELERA